MTELDSVIKGLEEVRFGRNVRRDTYSVERLDAALTYLRDKQPVIPSLLTWQEIAALPDGTTVWEECHDPDIGMDTIDLAMKIGGRLTLEDKWTNIWSDMGKSYRSGKVYRWWDLKPSEALSQETAWTEPGKDGKRWM